MRYANIFVHPEYKKRLKIEAAKQDISMVELTRRMARKSEEFIDNVERKAKKDFRFRV